MKNTPFEYIHSSKIVGSSSTSLKRTFENSFLIPQPNPRRLPTHHSIDGFVVNAPFRSRRPADFFLANCHPCGAMILNARTTLVGCADGSTNHSKKVYSTPQKTLPIQKKDGENFPTKQIVGIFGNVEFSPAQSGQ